ncbi:MAG: DUF1080 domain-containing protein [Verrucomicrobia bacterium]|nr:DUF1080 domain-containing protein [Verrucomicrobiota bacterium]
MQKKYLFILSLLSFVGPAFTSALQGAADGGWNSFRIECRGDSIKTWLNGVPAADLKDGITHSGFIALQVHGVGKREEPLQVRWRNIRLKQL